jgi:hypothetical protein
MRPRGRLGLVTVAVVAVVVAALVAVAAHRSSTGGAPPSGSAVPAPAPTFAASASLVADGCLGGTDASSAVLAAQQQATATPAGAASFAASYVRWGGQVPRPANIAVVGPKVWSDAFPTAARTLPLAAVPERTQMWASFASGRWVADNVSDDGGTPKLTVTLLLSEIADQGGQVQTTQASVSLRMHLAPGGWLVDGPEPVVLHSADEMATLGQPFYNGC